MEDTFDPDFVDFGVEFGHCIALFLVIFGIWSGDDAYEGLMFVRVGVASAYVGKDVEKAKNSIEGCSIEGD